MDSASPFPERVADPAWRRIDFVSDLHLSEAGPATFAAFRKHLEATPADALFILGDLFETWIGDDARHDGFEADVTAVLASAAARRPTFFMAGNRDFLVGAAMLEACGIEELSDPTVLVAFGERVLLTHGDAWCLDDLPYQQFRRQVRNPAWQAQVLSRPLAERRLMARGMRSESERRGAELGGEYADVDRATALAQMAAHRTPLLVHGHTHRPGSQPLDERHRRHVLSDWDLDHGTGRAEILEWSASGWRRSAPLEPGTADQPDPAPIPASPASMGAGEGPASNGSR